MKTGPTKVIVKHTGWDDATTGALVKDGLAARKEIEDYAAHRSMTLPVVEAVTCIGGIVLLVTGRQKG